MFDEPGIWIIAQIAASGAFVACAAARGRRGVAADNGAEPWIALALAMPFVAMFTAVGGDVRPVGPLALGGATVVSLVGAGLSLVVLGGRDEGGRRETFTAGPGSLHVTCAVAMASGVAVLLLAAAGRLTVTIGQTMLAAGVVYLWVLGAGVARDAPLAAQSSRATGSPAEFSQSGWLTPILALLVACECVCANRLAVCGEPLPASLIAGAQAALVSLLMMRWTRARDASLRASLSVGVFTALIGSGAVTSLSMARFLLLDRRDQADMAWLLQHGPAKGAAAFALEGALLAGAGAAGWIASRGDRAPARSIGTLLIIAGLTLAAWRGLNSG
jgi:hypothetical protein